MLLRCFRTSAAVALLFLTPAHAAIEPPGPTASPADTAAEEAALASIRPEAIRADMRFLSSDLLEGRGTGTRGHQIAASFMAAQFESLGLAPGAGSGTFLQDVPLQSIRVEPSASSFTVTAARPGQPAAGQPQALKFREDYILYGDPGRTDSEVSAPVVFVGFGITAPDQHYDDYRNVDVRGKIVAMVFGAPNFQSAVKAHYSASWLKRKNAAAHGAVGVLIFSDSRLEAMYPFEHQVRDLAFPRFNWLDGAGKPDHYYSELKAYGTLSPATVRVLLAGSGHTQEELDAGAKAGKLPVFQLPFNAQIHTKTQATQVHSPNVVARLEGSDPALKSQFIVYSAHLDHLGIGSPVDGDSLYNGSLDNASGSAEILEIARAFARMNPRPRRSLLFLAVTAEEAGLLGSDYFASNPTVQRGSIVANINIDEDVMLWPLRDVVAFGAEHSSLEDVVRRATRRLGMTASPDPVPEQVAFIRSDQYSFVRQGIPSLALSAGFKSDDPGINPRVIFESWARQVYHQPRDDMSQPGLDFEAAAALTRIGMLCGWYVAQDPEPPRWNSGDFFGTVYKAALSH